MKTLKFSPDAIPSIVSGIKDTTWRLFDEKDLQTKDEIQFINKETNEEFGTATITWVSMRSLGSLTHEDWAGLEKYSSEDAMLDQYRRYYPGQKVDSDTLVKIVTFKFTPKV
jgi:hypothetical protein